MNAPQQLAARLATSSAAVAFTGAGISTESGIPDFRSPGGVWSKHKPVYFNDFLASRSERKRYWKMRQTLYAEMKRAEPNEGHRALAELESRRHLSAVVTQNIDGLHQIAGSKTVLELHGTNRMAACMGCGREWKPESILARIEAGDEAPDCEDCGGPIKSKTISFGQAMPEEVMQQAAELSMAADVYLAIGSSLVVEPAASLPRLARQSGAYLVIINRESTPLDPIADLIIREGIGPALARVMRAMDAA